jgi:phosphatidylglycerol:prolipoprotein diacylglycerol transferase
VRFNDPAAERNVGVPLGIPLHPTQLYEALGTLILCVLLIRLERMRFRGETFARYLVVYGAMRFVIELFRGDPRGTVVGVLSTSQLFALVGIAVGITVYAMKRRGAPAPAAA